MKLEKDILLAEFAVTDTYGNALFEIKVFSRIVIFV